MEPRPYTFDRVIRIVFSVITLIAVLYLLHILQGVLLPFFVACLIAYILEPIVKWNMKLLHMKSRFIPVVLTLLETAVVFGGALALLIPYVVNETEGMIKMIKDYTTSNIHIPYISEQIHTFIRQNIDIEQLSRLISKDQWMSLIKNTLSSSWSVLSSSVGFIFGVVSWLIVVLYVIFIMIDYERLMLSFRQLVPYHRRSLVFHIFRDIKETMNRYFRGQFFIACLVGILFSIGFMIIGLPMGVVLGLFIGMLNMVPYLQLISLPITTLLCLVCAVSTGENFWIIFAESMAVYLVVQCIQDLFLTPKIMGKAMGLNPAIILLSLSVWGCLLGFLGLIIALPLTTLCLSYYNYYIVERKRISDNTSITPDPDNIQDSEPMK